MFSKQLAGISDPEAEKEIRETGFFQGLYEYWGGMKGDPFLLVHRTPLYSYMKVEGERLTCLE